MPRNIAMPRLSLLLATTNLNKVEEISACITRHFEISVESLRLFPDRKAPEETSDTYEGNARIKAIYYAKQFGRMCLAEDSGLEVMALDGRPGVHTARYSGVLGPNQEAANNAKLLEELKDVPPERRRARDISAVCIAEPEGVIRAEIFSFTDGFIAEQPRGDNGFGYDPLFIRQASFLPKGRDGLTNAELTFEEKLRYSSRNEAVKQAVWQIFPTRSELFCRLIISLIASKPVENSDTLQVVISSPELAILLKRLVLHAQMNPDTFPAPRYLLLHTLDECNAILEADPFSRRVRRLYVKGKVHAEALLSLLRACAKHEPTRNRFGLSFTPYQAKSLELE